jgi:hypothetical protein
VARRSFHGVDGVSKNDKMRYVCLFVLLALTACATQISRTADAVGCRRTDIDILNSQYKREGSTTVWCARCKDSIYKCVGNADKTRLECRPATADGGCT